MTNAERKALTNKLREIIAIRIHAISCSYCSPMEFDDIKDMQEAALKRLSIAPEFAMQVEGLTADILNFMMNENQNLLDNRESIRQ